MSKIPFNQSYAVSDYEVVHDLQLSAKVNSRFRHDSKSIASKAAKNSSNESFSSYNAYAEGLNRAQPLSHHGVLSSLKIVLFDDALDITSLEQSRPPKACWRRILKWPLFK